ncbi:MAG: hypothetical protein KAJ14_11765, partial [Candidatus Omnitrophica bacterium]|nr:hypothetical protein [Candidatus Omnitrophota bacterium]
TDINEVISLGSSESDVKNIMGLVSQKDIDTANDFNDQLPLELEQLAEEDYRVDKEQEVSGNPSARTLIITDWDIDSNEGNLISEQKNEKYVQWMIDNIDPNATLLDWVYGSGSKETIVLYWFIFGHELPSLTDRIRAIDKAIEFQTLQRDWALEDVQYLRNVRLNSPDLPVNSTDSFVIRERAIINNQIANLQAKNINAQRVIDDLQKDKALWVDGIETAAELAARKLKRIKENVVFYTSLVPVLNSMKALETEQYNEGLIYWANELTDTEDNIQDLTEVLSGLEDQLAKDPGNIELQRQIEIVKAQIINARLFLNFVALSLQRVKDNIEYLKSKSTSETKKEIIAGNRSLVQARLDYFKNSIPLLEIMQDNQGLQIDQGIIHWTSEQGSAEKALENLIWIRDNYQEYLSESEKALIPLQISSEQARLNMASLLLEGLNKDKVFVESDWTTETYAVV